MALAAGGRDRQPITARYTLGPRRPAHRALSCIEYAEALRGNDASAFDGSEQKAGLAEEDGLSRTGQQQGDGDRLRLIRRSTIHCDDHA